MMKNRDQEKLSETINNHSNTHEEARTPLDKFEDQKFADDIPLEDLKIEVEQEKNKRKTQNDSQSASKYEADFDKGDN